MGARVSTSLHPKPSAQTTVPPAPTVGGQSLLGILYHNGQGVAQDYAQAAVWFRKAANQGDADAQSNLGSAYSNGQGVPQDVAQGSSPRWGAKNGLD